MVKYAWIVFGAAASGVAISTVLGETSSWGTLVVLATFVTALATTVVARRSHPAVASRVGVARQRREQEDLDHDLVARVHEIVSERTIEWLKEQDFGSTWRDAPLAPLRELHRSDSIASGRFGADLNDAIADLYVATDAFFDFYDLNTRPDTLVVGSEWRELGSHSEIGTAARVETRDDPMHGVQQRLAERAEAIAHAWDVLATIESRTQRRGAGTPGQKTAGNGGARNGRT